MSRNLLTYDDLESKYPVLWSPAQVSPAGWWDASDESSFIADGSGFISQWTDLSGNARHALQATQAHKPTTGTRTFNGMNVVNFPGNGPHLEVQNIVGLDLEARDFYYVVQADLGLYSKVIFQHGEGAYAHLYGNNPGQIQHSGGGCYLTVKTDAGVGNQLYMYTNPNFNPHVDADPHIYNTRWARNVAHALDRDGIKASVNTGTPINGQLPVDNFMNLGGEFRAGDPAFPTLGFVGFIAEFIMLDTYLPTADKQKMEGYLAHKWGLHNKLQSSHPYKNRPPKRGD